MSNPFKSTDSPISELYSRARIKSKENRQFSRSPAQSYREFQVKIIRNALNNNHIIKKQYQGQKQIAIQRERRRSKYLGVQSQRYENSEQKNFELKRSESIYCSAQKQSLTLKELHFKKRDSQKTQNLVNFEGYSVQNVKSNRLMTYQSNYELINDQKSQGYVLPARGKIRVSKQISKKSIRASQRKCSITNSLDSQNDRTYILERTAKYQNSKNRIDQIREEYFNV